MMNTTDHTGFYTESPAERDEREATMAGALVIREDNPFDEPEWDDQSEDWNETFSREFPAFGFARY